MLPIFTELFSTQKKILLFREKLWRLSKNPEYHLLLSTSIFWQVLWGFLGRESLQLLEARGWPSTINGLAWKRHCFSSSNRLLSAPSGILSQACVRATAPISAFPINWRHVASRASRSWRAFPLASPLSDAITVTRLWRHAGDASTWRHTALN